MMTVGEMEMFIQICQGGLNFKSALEVSFSQSDKISTLLKQGIPFLEILCQSQNSSFYQNLKVLGQIFDLSRAFSICKQLDQSAKDLKELFIKESFYPLFLFVAAWAVNGFFIQTVMPSLMVYGGSDLGLLILLQRILNTIFFFGVGIIGMWVLVYPLNLPFKKLKKRIDQFGLVRQVHTIQMALLLEQLHSQGMSTKASLQTIAKLEKLTFCKALAQQWIQKMEQGISFETCLLNQKELDPAWKPFILCGMESGKLSLLLQGYIKQTRSSLQKLFKKAALYLQLLSYSTIGILVLSVYQAMLSPLNMLNSF